MLHVSVISPESSLYEGDATSVVAPAFDGEVGTPEHLDLPVAGAKTLDA